MVYDENGFLIPKIDNSICSHCGICKKVCYKYLNLEDIAENSSASKRIFAAWSKDSKIVQSTSSGGVGYELLKYYQEKSYNVAGVKYNFEKQRCEHIIATNPKDLEQIKGSKYLQSYTAEAFKNFKKAGKFVVIGTPCQIYGLRKLVTLWNRNDDFIFIDFYCHGTPII
jgi:coenzyme F420-reducing hydrogenase beta subunit